ATGSAHAQCAPNLPIECAPASGDVFADQLASYVGFAHVLNRYQPYFSADAYYWSSGHWIHYSLAPNAQVYVERYTAGWDWAYSYSARYWFVVSTSQIAVREPSSGLAL